MEYVQRALALAMRMRVAGAQGRSRALRLEALRKWLIEAAHLINCENGSIWAVDLERGTLTCMLGARREEAALKGYALRLGEGITGCAAQSMQPLVVESVAADRRHAPQADRLLHHVTREIVSCPMARNGVVSGVVNFLNRASDAPRPFLDEQISAAQILAGALIDCAAEADLMPLGSSAQGPPAMRQLARAFKGPEEPVFASGPLTDILARVRGSGDGSLMLRGEPGAGKQTLARVAHAAGPAPGGPFVMVDCAAIAPDRWDLELFGQGRRGRSRERKGLIELANGGTIFFKEVGSIPADFQPRLREFLEAGVIRRVGDSRARLARARIISATSRDLRGRELGFCKVLHEHLAKTSIDIPALRDRRDDIVPLVSVALRRLAERDGAAVPWLTSEAAEVFRAGDYPGNVAELIARVEGAYLNAREENSGLLRPGHVPGD